MRVFLVVVVIAVVVVLFDCTIIFHSAQSPCNRVANPGISAAFCYDKNGLCIAARGPTAELKPPKGVCTAIADRARRLHPDKPAPVIAIDVESPKIRQIIIKQHESMTVVLHKKKFEESAD